MRIPSKFLSYFSSVDFLSLFSLSPLFSFFIIIIIVIFFAATSSNRGIASFLPAVILVSVSTIHISTTHVERSGSHNVARCLLPFLPALAPPPPP